MSQSETDCDGWKLQRLAGRDCHADCDVWAFLTLFVTHGRKCPPECSEMDDFLFRPFEETLALVRAYQLPSLPRARARH